MALVDEQSAGVRPRTMTTGDGGKAKVWLDDSGHRLVMRTRASSAPGGHSSSGESYWERCATGGVLDQLFSTAVSVSRMRVSLIANFI